MRPRRSHRCDDAEHKEGDEERAASAAALLGEYLCRRLLRRLSHNAFSTVDVTDVSARAGIVSASDSVIAAVSTITGWLA